MSAISRLASMLVVSLALGCGSETSADSTPTGSAAADTPAAQPSKAPASGKAPDDDEAAPRVEMKTSLGTITLELNRSKSPITVENFLRYVESKHYDGTIFHRVMKGFMNQGGGMTVDGTRKPTRPPIVLEANNGLENQRGTIAMARTRDPDSATSQFFINTVDNSNRWRGSPGYAVFGKVVDGMSVVDKIAEVPVGPGNRPTTPVIIESVRRL